MEQLHYAELSAVKSPGTGKNLGNAGDEGQEYVLLVPESGEDVYLRFIEGPKGTEAVALS